jgi:hypothetical protein
VHSSPFFGLSPDEEGVGAEVEARDAWRAKDNPTTNTFKAFVEQALQQP